MSECIHNVHHSKESCQFFISYLVCSSFNEETDGKIGLTADACLPGDPLDADEVESISITSVSVSMTQEHLHQKWYGRDGMPENLEAATFQLFQHQIPWT